MSGEERRGHVDVLLLGRYRIMRNAARGAEDAAGQLAQLGEDELAAAVRRGAARLREAMLEMRVKLDEPHEYEPGQWTPPHESDPLCRVCGQPKRSTTHR